MNPRTRRSRRIRRKARRKMYALDGATLPYATLEDVVGDCRKLVAFISTAFSIHCKIERPEELLRFEVRTDASFNASCSLEPNGRTLVSVNLGVFVISRDIFFRLLSHPQVWPEIGDASLETEVPSLFDYFTNANDLIWQGSTTDMPLSPVSPKCPVRAAYADWLDFIACSFVILHELGHAFHGHLAVVGPGNALLEVDPEGTATADCLTRQALEYDADNFATNMILRLPNCPTDLLGRTTTQQQDLGTAIDVFRAVGTQFHLWCAGAKDISVHRLDLNHPPPRIRQQAISITLSMFLQARGIPPAKGSGFSDEFACIEGNYARLTGREIDVAQAATRFFDMYGPGIVRRWAEIHPKVNAVAWIPIPAPGDALQTFGLKETDD
ncbi:MAG: hypothetical protein IPK71_12010 [Myxococcales bacterium]|nr:hypothetical protein [Myxococcales bacterium]